VLAIHTYIHTYTHTYIHTYIHTYEGVSKNFRTGRLERELQIILWVSLVSFAPITLCVASQRVFIVVSVYFVIDSVGKILHTPSYVLFFLIFLSFFLFFFNSLLFHHLLRLAVQVLYSGLCVLLIYCPRM
jgi:hypothetical protein